MAQKETQEVSFYFFFTNLFFSFLMNNVSFYFRKTINCSEYAYKTLNKLYLAAAEKYVACCVDFKSYHKRTSLAEHVDLKICQIIYVVIRSFFKYLVCNVAHSVFEKKDYHGFFNYSLSFFEERFGRERNFFSNVSRILKAKLIKLEND